MTDRVEYQRISEENQLLKITIKTLKEENKELKEKLGIATKSTVYLNENEKRNNSN